MFLFLFSLPEDRLYQMGRIYVHSYIWKKNTDYAYVIEKNYANFILNRIVMFDGDGRNYFRELNFTLGIIVIIYLNKFLKN